MGQVSNWLRLLVFPLLLLAGCSNQSSKEVRLKRADEYFAAQRFEEAFIEYRNVLNMDPTNYTAIRNLGLIFHEQGMAMQAFAFLNEAKNLNPEDLEVRLKLGRMLQIGRKFKESRDEAEYLLSKQPTNTEALVLYADSATTSNQVAGSLEQLDKLRPVAGSTPGFHLALGTLFIRTGRTNEAEASFKQALELNPQSSSAFSGLGLLAASRNDLEAAGRFFTQAAELSPYRSSQRLRLADFKIRNGDIEGGKAVIEEMTRRVPDYLPAWIRLADLAFEQGHYDECDDVARKVLGRDPKHFEALMFRGQVKLSKGDKGALADFEKMASLYPNLPQILHKLAQAQLLNRDVSGAIASLNQAINISPNYPDSVMLLAELVLRRGDTLTAIVRLHQLIQVRPDLSKAYLLLAGAYASRGSKNDAMNVYRRMAELFPENPQAPFLMGMLMLQQARTNEARVSFDKALELSPRYPPAVEQLVNLDLAQNQVDSALNRAREQIHADPKTAFPLMLTARVEMARTNSTEAEDLLTKAIHLEPNLRAPYMLLARLHIASKKHEEALKKLERVVANDPQDVTALLQIGMIHEYLNNFDKARQAYETLIEINPRFSPALNNLAYLYAERYKEFDKAYQMALKARELAPLDPFAADTLGWILFQRGEYPWALSLLQESADKLPTDPEVLYHLGKAHYMMGEEHLARSNFEKARQFNKEFKGKKDIVRSLANLDIDVALATEEVLMGLERSLAEEPRDPVVLARLAAIYERDGAITKAVQSYKAGLKVNPNNPRAMINLARLYSDRLDDPGKALDLAKAARTLAPDDPQVAHTVGRLAFAAGEHAWAYSLFQESVRKLHSDPSVLSDLAWAQFSLGRVDEAQATMRIALSQAQAGFKEASAATNFVAMTELFLHPEEVPGAMDRVRQTLEVEPGFGPALAVQGIAWQRQAKPEEARKSFELVLKKYPSFTPAYKYLAIILMESKKDLDVVFEYAKKAREAWPEDAEVAKVLGLINYQRKNFSRAAYLLEQAGGVLTSDASVLFHLGMAHYRLNQMNPARRELEKAVRLEPKGGFVEEANHVLEGMK